MKNILIAFVFAATLQLAAQKPIKVKFYQSMVQETTSYRVAIEDAVSKQNLFKFKMVITNKTDKTILIRPSGLKVYMDDSLFAVQEDMYAIAPFMSANKVIDIKGTRMMGNTLKIVTEGIFSENGAQKDSVTSYKLGNSAQTTDKIILVEEKTIRGDKKSYTHIKLQYTGDGVLRMTPGKVRIKAPNGVLFVPETTKPAFIYLDKNSRPDKFSIYFAIPPGAGDMVTQEILLVWLDAFETMQTSALPSATIICPTDVNKTADKNK